MDQLTALEHNHVVVPSPLLGPKLHPALEWCHLSTEHKENIIEQYGWLVYMIFKILTLKILYNKIKQ